jgi:hypothetical protein
VELWRTELENGGKLNSGGFRGFGIRLANRIFDRIQI